MLKYSFYLCITVLCLASCATESRFERKYSSWIGSDREELMSAWGKPQVILMANENKTEYGYNLSLSKNRPLPDTCILYFITDSTGVIIGIRHEGNRCKRAPSFV